MEFVFEKSLDTTRPKFLVDGAVASRVVERGGKQVVQFGEFSRTHLVVLSIPIIVTVVTIWMLGKYDKPVIFGILPLFPILVGYGWYFMRQNHLKGIELELETKRCLVRNHQLEQIIENIDGVMVLNSHRDRDGHSMIEGISELFVCFTTNGERCLVPIARDDNYGQFDELGWEIARRVCGTLTIMNRA